MGGKTNTGVMERKQEKCRRVGLRLFLELLKKVGSESAGEQISRHALGQKKNVVGLNVGSLFFK